MLIGLVGFAGSGKDTTADYLVENYNFTKYAFSDTLKDVVSIIFDWPRHLLNGDTVPSRVFRENIDSYWSEKLDRVFTPRLALQLMGTEAGRNVFHQDIWLHSLLKRLQVEGNSVISDVRFPNEIEAIIASGGEIVRIRRDNEPEWYSTAYNENITNPDDHWILYDRKETMDRKYPNVHVSKWAWIGHPEVRYIIDNYSTRDALYAKIDKYMFSQKIVEK